MAGGDAELCGFLDAKLPGGRCMSQRVRKRSLAPWKVWRRHWCSVRKLGPGLGVEVQLDCGISSGNGSTTTNERENSIKVPSDSIICRTESRTKQFAFGIFPPKERKPLLYLCANSETETQRWMANLRHLLKPRKHRFMEGTFNISMVDNAHSRASGLTGLHGDLVASRSGVFIKDVNSGEIIENLDWKDMDQFHLSTSGRPEDVKRICVIHTTKEFRNGVGELEIFCLNASKLLHDFVTQGRGPKLRNVCQRPLSLSEGDLRLSIHNDEIGNFPVLKSKVASGLVTAGLGLLLSSRSGSEARLLDEMKIRSSMEKMAIGDIRENHRRAIDNVYQPEPASVPNIRSSFEELDSPPCTRRTSGISIASGIYEEINENQDSIVKGTRLKSNIYEVPEEILGLSTIGEKPPPLPPRKLFGNSGTRNECLSDDGLDSEGGTRSVTPCTQDERTPEDKSSIGSLETMENSDYVPMSPRLKDIALNQLKREKSTQEEVYMVMR